METKPRMCDARGVHNWSNWGESTHHDILPVHGYRYKRECQQMGCPAVELAHNLVAVGPTWVTDEHELERG
jgi:hypothetical protein